jgi:hypothetical protein
VGLPVIARRVVVTVLLPHNLEENTPLSSPWL